MRTIVVTTAVASALLTVASPAHAAQPGRPLVADIAGTAAPDSTGVAFTGAGVATLLGRITSTGQTVVTGAADGQCPGGLANTNTLTLWAADGDSVVVRSEDVACPSGTPGSYDGTGSWTIVSGTGRLAHATGSGLLSGHLDLQAGSYQERLQGTLTRDAR